MLTGLLAVFLDLWRKARSWWRSSRAPRRSSRPRIVVRVEWDVRGLEAATAQARRLADRLEDAREAWDTCPEELRRRLRLLEPSPVDPETSEIMDSDSK